MTVRGIAKGKIIELDQPLPYPDGQAIDVSVDLSGDVGPMGSPTRILHALKTAPAVEPEAFDELDRIIRAARLPAKTGSIFGDD